MRTKRIVNKWDKYGRLTIIEEVEKKWWARYVLCLCDCWKKKVIRFWGMYKWDIKSCGCYNSECLHNRWIHYLTWTKFYKSRTNVKFRCNNQKYSWYKNYWWRWITYCSRWDKFENFKDDMYASYIKHIEEYGEKNTSLDRINMNWNYEPCNCRRATNKEQSNNTRCNRYIEYKWETHTLKEWSNILHITYNALLCRINKYWWTIEKAFETKYMWRLILEDNKKDEGTTEL